MAPADRTWCWPQVARDAGLMLVMSCCVVSLTAGGPGFGTSGSAALGLLTGLAVLRVAAPPFTVICGTALAAAWMHVAAKGRPATEAAALSFEFAVTVGAAATVVLCLRGTRTNEGRQPREIGETRGKPGETRDAT